MEDDLQGVEVLNLIRQYLRDSELDTPERQHELVQSVFAAIADHSEDVNAQAAAALAAVVAYGAIIDLQDFEEILQEIRQIEGLESVEDVHYVGLGSRGDALVSIRTHMPKRNDRRLTEDDRQAIGAFIEGAIDIKRNSRIGGFDGAPNS